MPPEKRTYVVTGAASGIGLGIARHLIAGGARVAMLDVREGALLAAASEFGPDALALTCDLTDERSVRVAFEAVADWADAIDGVVASAGVQLFGQDAAIQDLDLEVFDRTAAVNVRGAVLTGKYGSRALIEAGRGGSIVLIGSPTGLVGQARGFTSYSTSKAAIFGLSRVMAADLAEFDIRVNVVVPGFTDTPLVRSLIDDPGATAGFVAKIPLRRPGTPEDIAPMVEFLLREGSSYATGAVFTVDGGMLAV